MKACPHKNCHFKSNVSVRLQHHLEVSGHGRTDAGKKAYRGHLAIRGKKKPKS